MEPVHVLILSDEDGEPTWEVEHPECALTFDAAWRCNVYTCDVEWEVETMGVDYFFTTERVPWLHSTVLTQPGRYLIRRWSEPISTRYGPEPSTGLELVYPEEAAAD